MIKWTEESVLAVIAEARKLGAEFAAKKLAELQRNGPQYEVTSGSTTVGTLLDVCGSAHLKISARGKFYQIAKKLSADKGIYRFLCDRAYHGGGMLCIFDSTMRQEMSVNVAACKGQQSILETYGIDATIKSRID